MNKTTNRMKRTAAFVVTALLLAPLGVLHAAEVRGLRCESVENALGIDVAQPRLSWLLDSGRQTAYQVVVNGLWDSGKIDSDQSINVAYAGKPLESRQRCEWKVRVWDQDGKPSAWSQPTVWTMGFLKPEDWTAQWITAPAVPNGPPDKSDLTVRKATYRTLDGSVEKDVTGIVKAELAKKKIFRVDFKALGGDPAPNVVKELVVEYVRNGKPNIARAADFKTMDLSGDGPATASPTLQFRKDFTLDAAPVSAHVTVNSPAYFELYVNGEKVGKDVLSPAVSKLDAQTFSLTYDVGSYLKAGANCIGIWLGAGWADAIVVRAQLDAVVKDKRVTIGTDTSWRTRASGRYKIGQWKWGGFGGELVDAREVMEDWCRPETDASSWRNAAASNPKLGPVQTQPCPGNRLGEPIAPVSITAIGKGFYEIDFGKSLTGWFRMEMPQLAPGTEVTMTFADTKSELCKKLATIGDTNAYQTFRQISKFVSGGKPGEVFQHKFNYAAFRYVIVKGLSSTPPKESATARLIDSDLEEVGYFECSNALLNRIHKVNQWTQRCLDLGGYYVDCPHRERMGYGDGQVAVEGFMTNFRADGFYRKWLADWRLLQKPDGGLPNSAPFGQGGGGPGWGGLLSAITWRHYLYYGDARVLEENYDAIRRYVEYLEKVSRENGDILTGKTGKFSFIGDWVAPGRGMDSNDQPTHKARELFNNCYRINQMELLVNMARVLGKTDDVATCTKRLAEIRPKVHEAFYAPAAGFYVSDEQAHYVMPLMTGVVPEALRPMVFQNLETNILKKKQGHLDTGMLGTYFMMEYLRAVGRSDLVFTMFSQTTYPGWGYMIEQGATTFWEQWNGYWSQLHSCFTSPDNWLYQGLAGIQADPAAPGFKNVIIKPAIVGDVTWVKAHHDSPYGRIVSNWQRDGKKLTLDVTIPANSSATVFVPGEAPRQVGPGHHQFKSQLL